MAHNGPTINPSSIALKPCETGFILNYEIQVSYGGNGTYDCSTRWECKQEAFTDKEIAKAGTRMQEIYKMCSIPTSAVKSEMH